MPTLRVRLIRLAYTHPDLQPIVLPLLSKSASLNASSGDWNPWTAPLGEKRPQEPAKGSYEAYVKRKKDKGEKPRSKEEWAKIIKQHRFPID